MASTTSAFPQGFTDLPPAYEEIDAPPPVTILPLKLYYSAGSPRSSTVTRDECAAHLKFLAVLADLRESVSAQDGLFGLHDEEANYYTNHRNENLSRIREKRWAVFAARAVDRYSTWWQQCVTSSEKRPTLETLRDCNYSKIINCASRLKWGQEYMPPLDVLMVWHSHMLNPRAFLEDCIRYGKMSLWETGFPWSIINRCFNEQSLEYDAGEAARYKFERTTNRTWDNLQDAPMKYIECPSCKSQVPVRWSAGKIPYRSATPFEEFYGFADKSFNATCPRCCFIITHDKLKVAKFRTDLQNLTRHNLPMPGTFYNVRGIPETVEIYQKRFHSLFPNQFLKIVGKEMLGITHTKNHCTSVDKLRDELQFKLSDREVLIKIRGYFRTAFPIDEKIAFRRMMSSYWDNVSMFSMDLVGAVIRQGTFVQKMDQIDWIHSPTVMTTMDRLINKYKVFFKIMASNPRHMAVPTLDVDLAWHTHQLSPSRYFEYSTHQTKQYTAPIFIDHDDKVDENKLSDGFEWTSKMYKKLTNGQIYSECTCWYCEATRAPDLHSGSTIGSIIFSSTTTSRAREIAATLHDRPDISSDPDRNPHISAHNAVRPDSTVCHYTIARRLKAIQLQSSYERACRRAGKRRGRSDSSKPTAPASGGGGSSSISGTGTSGNDTRRSTAANDVHLTAWGVPVYVPYYAPYMCDPGVHPDAYACNPACMNLVPGGHGNCAAGTCGGAVAAGSCGGAPGGTCSGGCAGGGGGCGGGGGGGGGGCGGGGGGGGGGGC